MHNIPEKDGEQVPPGAPPEMPPAAVPRSAMACLLKAPAVIVRRIRQDEDLWPLAGQLVLWGLLFHAVYGFAMALFVSADVAVLTAGKASLIGLAALLLCLPSLYVFSCVAGAPITVTQACALGGSVTAMTGLLLAGFTPIAWLFSVSTDSLPFVVLANVTAWGIAVGFSRRIIGGVSDGMRQKGAGLKWWLFVYVLVSMQMATIMRPLLGRSDEGWRETGKKFFLRHFQEVVFGGPEKPLRSEERRYQAPRER